MPQAKLVAIHIHTHTLYIKLLAEIKINLSKPKQMKVISSKSMQTTSNPANGK